MSDSPTEAMMQPDEKTVELTLTIEGHYDVPGLEKTWTPDHAYGPIERVTVEREMFSAVRNYDITDVSVEVVNDE